MEASRNFSREGNILGPCGWWKQNELKVGVLCWSSRNVRELCEMVLQVGTRAHIDLMKTIYENFDFTIRVMGCHWSVLAGMGQADVIRIMFSISTSYRGGGIEGEQIREESILNKGPLQLAALWLLVGKERCGHNVEPCWRWKWRDLILAWI